MLAGRLSRKTWLIGGAAVAVVAIVLTVVLVTRDDPEPRARQYTAATACLLTPAAGVTDRDAVPVWDGMQKASLATHGKVRYLAVIGDQTPANAATYLATLALGNCNLILAAGPAPAAAVDANAAAYPKLRFVVVGAAKDQANVTALTNPAAVTGLVTDALKAAA
ncbi:hypothetical protein [Paractinoplanes globisporus]|uniref:BMP family ABC transporter substrate-binding protein n=1 Tax=Paractinoplanes globisporus TaxID=113565 RepID=A0ABW6W9V0_9ACTN|nr:hypothetical protein [Actinoplanes globisporus]